MTDDRTVSGHDLRGPGAESQVDALANRFWEGFLERNPVWATVFGDERYDDRLDDRSAAGRAADLAALDELERDAAALDHPDLPTEDRVTLDILRVTAHVRRVYYAHELWQMDGIDQMAGPQTMPTELARFQRLDTPERLARLVARLDAYPAYMAQVGDNIRAGLAAGRTAARAVVERTITQTRRAVETPTEASALLAAHPELTDDQRAVLVAAIERSVQPALKGFLELLEGYLPDARRGGGHLLAARWRGDSTAMRSWPRRRSTRRPRRSTTTALRVSRPWTRSGLSSRDASGSPTPRRTGRSWRPTRRTTSPSPAELVRPRAGTGRRARSRRRRSWFGASAERRLRGACRSSRTRSRRRRRRSTSRRPRTARDRAGTTSTPSNPVRGRCIGSPPPRSTRRPPAITSRSPSRPSCPSCTTFRRLGSRLAGMAYAEGLGPVQRAARRRDGPVRRRPGALRHARLRRPGEPPGWWSTPGIHAFRWTRQQSIELPARARRPQPAGGGDRDRPLHRLARAGARLHDRPARDRGPAPRCSRSATATGSTCARSTTRSSATDPCRWPPSDASCRGGSCRRRR